MVDKLPTSTGERRISEPPTDRWRGPKHQKEVEADRFFFKKENGKKNRPLFRRFDFENVFYGIPT